MWAGRRPADQEPGEAQEPGGGPGAGEAQEPGEAQEWGRPRSGAGPGMGEAQERGEAQATALCVSAWPLGSCGYLRTPRAWPGHPRKWGALTFEKPAGLFFWKLGLRALEEVWLVPGDRCVLVRLTVWLGAEFGGQSNGDGGQGQERSHDMQGSALPDSVGLWAPGALRTH